MTDPPPQLTQVLEDWSHGDDDALKRLIPLVYPELRRIAGHQLRRERTGHTLQPTALIHEAYLRLVNQRSAHWQNRAQFFAVAGRLMRRILVDHARGRGRVKRGGAAIPSPFENALLLAAEQVNVDVLALDQALSRLDDIDVRQSQVVELRFFSGLSIEETAAVLGVSAATVKNDWNMAKAWLRREMVGTDTP